MEFISKPWRTKDFYSAVFKDKKIFSGYCFVYYYYCYYFHLSFIHGKKIKYSVSSAYKNML